jgi:hypothetical protein
MNTYRHVSSEDTMNSMNLICTIHNRALQCLQEYYKKFVNFSSFISREGGKDKDFCSWFSLGR